MSQKPTNAQIRILRRCAAGEVIKALGGPEPAWFFRSGERSLDYRSVFHLIDREWIEAFKPTPHALNKSYRITHVGREALRVIDAWSEKSRV